MEPYAMQLMCYLILSSRTHGRDHGPSWEQLDGHLGSVSIQDDIDGLVQKRRNSNALAMELSLSCTNPSICNKIKTILFKIVWQKN